MGRRRLLFVALVALWWVRMDGPPVRAAVGLSGPAALAAARLDGPANAAALPEWCDDVCTSEASCTDTCFATELDFENGTPISCYTWGTYAEPCCGDGYCNGGEDYTTCFGDCHCGDGVCNAGETISTCPDDCYTGSSHEGGMGVNCGNHQCDEGEDCDNCPKDCFDGEANNGGLQCDECGGADGCNASLYGGFGSGNDGKCIPGTDTWCTFCPESCGDCDAQGCWPQVCDDGGWQGFAAVGRGPYYGKCVNCTADGQCGEYEDYYGGPAWCATEEGQCVTYCYSDVDCPNSWEWYCTDYGWCTPTEAMSRPQPQRP